MFRPASVLAPAVFLIALIVACCAPGGADPAGPGDGSAEALPEDWARAVELHNRGFAALENEQPAEAEAAYRELTQIKGDDPMPRANLAVALLRQQKTDEALEAVDAGIERVAENRGELLGRLLAIRGAILDWEGRAPEALVAYRKASESAPAEPEILYTLYRQAVSLGEDAAADRALEHLVELRPENFVVLIERAKRAIHAGDREAATGAALRIGELLWQAPPIAETALDGVVAALEQRETPIPQAARVPVARLENVLKVTPMYRESLRELSTGIQAVPVRHFAAEPPAMELGDPLDISFTGERISEVPTLGRALVVDDLDGSGAPTIARILDREPAGLEVRSLSAPEPHAVLASPGATGLVAADLAHDGGVDLLAYGPGGDGVMALWDGRLEDGPGTLSYTPVELAEVGLAGAGGATAAVLDFDIEGDLDLVLAGGEADSPAEGSRPRSLQLYRNSLEWSFEAVGERVFPAIGNLGAFGARDTATIDLDRDGDTDLVLTGAGGLLWLDNLRQGRFADRTAAAGLDGAPAAEAVVTADLDNDGMPEIVTGGEGITVWANRLGGGTDGEGFTKVAVDGLPTSGAVWDLAVLDLDNDGRLDLVTAGPEGVAAFGQTDSVSGIGSFRSLPISDGPPSARAVEGADLDGDGDLDLVAAGPEGLYRLTNEGGNRNGWLAVRLRGLVQGNSKNNLRGAGASVEVLVGTVTQFREHDGGVSHFGLGRQEEAEVVRVVWTNGVPQDRVGVARDQRIVEEQVLKGSCPFLYTYTGEGDGDGVGFVTDLLWNAPAGLPLAPGVYAPSDPDELVEVVGARSLPGRPGVYDLRITEELWEAAYFDHVRLWVVDHSADVEVASNLKIVPGEPAPEADRVLATRNVRPVVAAVDGTGRDVTGRVATRDDVYADGYRPGPYQGLADEPWTFTFDLGPEAASRPNGGPVRLLLDGWIFPTDASLNLAISQRDDLAPQAPRLELETEDGWRVLMPNMGHPAGKTKTMVVDTPPLPEGARRLRIVTNQWISWDRVAWSAAPLDSAAGTIRVAGRLEPEEAELRFRGFSKPVRRAPNAPHEFDYARVSRRSPWEPTPGPYTKYGDVRELLESPDDRSVILAAGDEVRLLFDASDLGPPPEGWTRTLFLESHGWDKDFDRNTWAAESGSLPLPFRSMGTYGPSMEDLDAPDLEDYRKRWLTRTWPGPPDRAADGRGEGAAGSPGRAANAED